MAKSKSSAVTAVREDEPIVISGPPRKLTGSVLLHNKSDSRVVVRDAGLNDAEGLLPGGPVRFRLRKAVLRPDQGRDFPLKLTLDATTPPGEYQVELEVAGRTLPAVLHVSEIYDLKLEPDTIVIANRADEKQRRRIVVTNTGNASFTIGAMGNVLLKDDFILERALQLAVERQPEVDLEELIVAVVRLAREESGPDINLLVDNLSGTVRVEPGQTVAVDLEATLEEAVPPNRRYRGRLPILEQDLEFLVVATTDPSVEPPAAQEEQATPKKSTKRRTRSKKSTNNGGDE